MRKLTYSTLILSIAMLFLMHCNKKQEESYTIKGKVDGFKDSTMLFLRDSKKEKKIDSTYIVEGKFEFQGQVEEPRTMMVFTKFEKGKRPVYTSFWVENSNIKLKGDADNFKYAKVTGSSPQKKADILSEKVKPYNKKRDSLIQEFRKMRKEGAEPEKQTKIRNEIRKADSIRSKLEMEFIKNHTNSYEALQRLTNKKNSISEDTLQKLYKSMKPKYQKSSYGQVISTYLNVEKAKIGEHFINFKANTMKGDSFQLSEIKDKYIILDFWSPGCGFCRKANKFFAKEYSGLQDSIEIVGFALSKNKDRIEKAIQEDNIQWPVASTFKGMDGEIALKYEIRGVPTFYIISPSGEIIDKIVGFSQKQYEKIMATIENHKI